MKRAYVAHPYAGKEGNKKSVEEIIKFLSINNPETVYFSPIHAFGYLYNDVSYKKGIEYCFEFLKSCDELILCEGWKSSRGCNLEKKFAEDHGIPISFFNSYKRLGERREELNDLYDRTEDEKYLIEMDCIDHFYGCDGYKTYEKIAEYAKQHNFKRVFDIGCAYGHQSEIFLGTGLKYIGIEAAKNTDYWNIDKFQYITDKYPFKIDTADGDLAVSVLCLTWNCFLNEHEKTLKEQLEALQRDFKHCLLYLDDDKVDFVKQYYKNFEVIAENLIYFSN